MSTVAREMNYVQVTRLTIKSIDYLKTISSARYEDDTNTSISSPKFGSLIILCCSKGEVLNEII
jgi:hypothetical protein